MKIARIKKGKSEIFDNFVCFHFQSKRIGVFVSKYCLDISVICCLVIDALLFDGIEKQ